MNKDTSLSMNEELQQWLQEAKEEIKIPKGKQQTTQKKPSGKCQICGEKSAKVICLKCGKAVCGSCYFKIIGVCKRCVPKETAAKWEGKHPNWEEVLGVEWVD